ncbi:NADH:ubiquinone oxidoreductase intermediate-associated protein 30 [Trinorchestia longiramus]|nr:NADH:ubiquinone oxidoreductase intermediate-associated protein 30 [Trinorchestia longiramus]
MPSYKSVFRLISLTAVAGCISSSASHDVEFNKEPSKMLYDFRTIANVDDWIESSDTVRRPGMSKAVFTLQKTREFQRGVFFSLLNPQPNGAGFAGVANKKNWDLVDYEGLELKVRAQGESDTYKVVLYHKGQSSSTGSCSYQAFYTVSLREWSSVRLPFTAFEPHYRGAPCNETEPLDTSSISSVGLQIVGGVYEAKKQKGASSLEIDYIQAYV